MLEADRSGSATLVLLVVFFFQFFEIIIFLFFDVATYRAGRDDVTTGKLFPSRGECLGLYRCVLIIFKRK